MAPPKNPYSGFFQRLTKLFRSGPSIRRKVKGYDYRSLYDREVALANQGWRGGVPFGRDVVGMGAVMGQYGMVDRFARYQEFVEAEHMAEVAAALNVLADEAVASDENGKAFHIYSDNPEVRRALDELFYDVMNIEYNLRYWVRNMCKYGDNYLVTEVIPEFGITNVAPIPVTQIERDEGFDPKDPYAVRFRWQAGASRYLQNWQVCHFRMMGSDAYYPYGTSILDPARRIIRQLVLCEDAMLTYRIARSSERRVFYVDTAGIPPNDVPSYMGRVQAALKSSIATDKQTGRLDYRHNPISITEDLYIPTRGNNFTTKVETLAGGQNTAAVEDVEYLQNKLFAALQIPKSYLGFGDALSSKATLSLLDVRFSRTISVIQKVIIGELNKLAMIHLYARGFDGEDLVDFDLRLSNPSTIAMQQKLELWAARFNIAGTAKEVSIVDEEWIQKNILGLTNDEIARMMNGRRKDRSFAAELESITPPQTPPEAPEPSHTDLFDQSNYQVPGQGLTPDDKGQTPEEPGPEGAPATLSGGSDDTGLPVKPSGFLARHKKNTSRHRGYQGAYAQASPDFSAMLTPSKNVRMRDISDQEFLKSKFTEANLSKEEIQHLLFPETLVPHKIIDRRLKSAFRQFDEAMGRKPKASGVLAEGWGSDKDDDVVEVDIDEGLLSEEDRVTTRIDELLVEDPRSQESSGAGVLDLLLTEDVVGEEAEEEAQEKSVVPGSLEDLVKGNRL